MDRVRWGNSVQAHRDGFSPWIECKSAWTHDGFLGIQVNDSKIIWVPAQHIQGIIEYEREVQDEAANVAPDAP